MYYIGIDTECFSPGDRPRARNRVLIVARLVLKTLYDDVGAAGEGA